MSNTYGQFAPFSEFGQSELTPTEAILVDIDGDEKLDILFNSNRQRTLFWYQNLDNGEFSEKHAIINYTPLSEDDSHFDILFDYGDFDSDGDFDILFVERESNFWAWYENNGNGNSWTERPVNQIVNEILGIEVTDFDNDGDDDILASFLGESSMVLFENIDLGIFNNAESLELNGSIRPIIEAVHLNDDDLIDIVVASDQSLKWFLNEGNQEFYSYTITLPNEIRSVKTGDINNDGYVDIYAGTDNNYIAWWKNQLSEFGGGEEAFEMRPVNSGFDVIDCLSVEAFDIDDDGDLDMAASHFDEAQEKLVVSWYENTNEPYFVSQGEIHPNSHGADFLTSGDLTGNGIPDFVSVNTFHDQVNLTLQTGIGEFSDTKELTSSKSRPASIIHADIDGDNLKDMITASYYDGKICFHKNLDGQNYGSQIVITDLVPYIGTVKVTDINGDGNKDVICYSQSNTNDQKVCWIENEGDGQFSSPIVLTEETHEFVFFVDYEEDGDMDILLSEQSGFDPQEILLLENTGFGEFNSHILFTAEGPLDHFIYEKGDIDGDGDLDFLAVKHSFYVGWFENLGEFQFSEFHNIDEDLTGASVNRSLHARDIDNDGMLDIVARISFFWPLTEIVWYKNLGEGNFSDRQVIVELTHISNLEIMDVNNDGWEDIIVPRTYDEMFLIEQIGEGNFSSGSPITGSPLNAHGIIGSDIDNDGDNDILGARTHSNGLVKGFFFTLENTLYYPNQAQGRIFMDVNENGLHDSLDIGLTNIGITSMPQAEYSVSYENGDYHLYIDDIEGTEVIIAPETIPGWAISTENQSYAIVTSENNNFVDSLDFGFVIDSVFTDITLDLTGGFPRCNTPVNYWLNLSNQGTNTPSGYISLTLDDSLTYMSSSLDPDSVVSQTVFWTLDSLPYFSEHIINILVEMPSFTAIDDTLHSTLSFWEMNPNTEELFVDSVYLNQVVLCAYDPNDKSVIAHEADSAGYILPGDELEYLIRFQNTGTDTAFHVVIQDLLMPELDYSTFQPLASSHEMQTYLHDNGQLEFSFFNIMLPDSGTNFLGSQGFVKFKIRTAEMLPPNTPVLNTAEIFFDYNPAILTNTTETVVACYTAPSPFISFEYPFLNAGDTNGAAYQWFLNGDSIYSGVNFTLNPEENGLYTVLITDFNGCQSMSEPFDFGALSSVDVAFSNFEVYPVPSSSDVTFNFGEEIQVGRDLMIYNVLGEIIYVVKNLSSESWILKAGSIPHGVYFAVLRKSDTGETLTTRKFILQ